MEWRKVSFAEFREKCGLSPVCLVFLDASETIGRPADAGIPFAARAFFDSGNEKGIQKLPNSLRKQAEDADTIVSVWLDIGRKHGLDWTQQHLVSALKARLKNTIGPGASANLGYVPNAARAFAIGERPGAGGQYASQVVYDKLLGQHNEFKSAKYFAPYTTIVGPSGIGKTFSVQQLAVRHGLYVSYANLASDRSSVYPRPTMLGNWGHVPRDEDAWVKYIGRQMDMIACCKEVGVTAPGLFAFASSSKPEIETKRIELDDLVLSSNGDLPAETLRTFFLSVKTLLGDDNTAPVLSPPQQQPPGEDQRPAIICFDEARALLDEESSVSFRKLRTAASRLAGEEKFRRADNNPTFFVLLLDTTSRITNFTPQLVYDPSARAVELALFSPIYEVDTLDVLAPKHPESLPLPTGTEYSVKELFSCGRPLWGGFLRTASSLQHVIRLASGKVGLFGTKHADVHGIAVLSYRMRFYISQAGLAQDLVASMMRYILAIAPERNWLLTTHPSEPVLAFVASCLLQTPATRCDCVQAWAAALYSGTVNPGDIGEQIASLLLLFSWDYAARPSMSSLPRAISCRAFLSALLGTDAIEQIESGKAGTGVCHNVLASESTVFVNHIVRAMHKPSPADLNKAYRRGYAMFLPPNFPGMDIAIPIHVAASTDDDDDGTALLLIQVKNRKADSHTDGLVKHMQEDLDKAVNALGFPNGTLRGIFGVTMCLRTNGVSKCVTLVVPDSSSSAEIPSKRPRLKEGKAESSSSIVPVLPKPELVALLFGCDAAVYACLGVTSKDPPSPETPATPAAPATSDATSRRATRVAVAKAKAADSAYMDEIGNTLRNLLAHWPEVYGSKDMQSTYARRLVDPSYDINADKEEEEDKDKEEDNKVRRRTRRRR